MTATNLAAALLRDVPHDYNENGERVMLETQVLTALSRALDPALAERAGEVLEGVTPDWEMDATGVYDRVLYAGGIVCVVHSTEADARFIAWCREGVPALLAQNAALRVERDKQSKAHEKEIYVWSENYAALERRLTAAEAEVEELQRDLNDTTAVAENYTNLVRCKGGRIRNAGNSGYVCFICGVDTSIGEKCRAALTTEASHE